MHIKLLSDVHNGVELESEDLSVARFITHLRYLFVRMAEHSQLDSPGSPVSNVINDQYPDAAQCARTVAGVAFSMTVSGLHSGKTLLNPRARDAMRAWSAG